MEKSFSRILYGGDYNPNQWPKEIWTEDMRIFKKGHLNSATINVFSWAKIQPSEEVYDFSELDDIIAMLSAENYDIVLATGTGAMPAWMAKKYPEVTRVDYEGRKHKFGQRHNACPNSLVFQKYSAGLAEKLAERYQDNSHITCWHVNNEYGGECYCENCAKAFRVWLKKRYKTLDAVNKAWNTEFWGHTFYDWDEIEVPNLLSEGMVDHRTAFAGISLDYRRFNSDSLLNNYKLERDAIKKYLPEALVTTNLMGTYKGLDYFSWAKEMDIISWDNYPAYDTPWSYVSMCHDLMRGLKKKPFMLMEQTPSQQNWQAYNSLKQPGQMRAQSLQTLAHGADTIQFFQLRRSLGACEKFHGAVIEHVGHENTRVFKEVEKLGADLEKLTSLIGAKNPAKVALMFDWENYWALEYTSGPNVDLKYVDQIHQYYRYFYEQHIPVDFIHPSDDLTGYDLVVAPVLYLMKEGWGEKITEYVKNGGHFFTTYMSGLVNESDNVYLGGYPGPLREVCGIWVEEIDALAPEQTNDIKFNDGTTGKGYLVADLLHLENAQSLGSYTSNFYAGMPVATKNELGQGTAYYLACDLVKDSLDYLMDQIIKEVGIKPLIKKTTLEITQRQTAEETFTFVLNLGKEEKEVPEELIGKKDYLSGKTFTKGKILPYEAFVIVEKNN